MKEVTQYECSVCKGKWDSEEACLACEATHEEILKTEIHYSRRDVFPTQIKLTTKTGRMLFYYLSE